MVRLEDFRHFMDMWSKLRKGDDMQHIKGKS